MLACAEAPVMSPALAQSTVCVCVWCASSATTPRLTCAVSQVVPVGHEQLRQPSVSLWSQLQLFELTVVKLFVTEHQQYCFVLVCAWGVMKSFVLGDVRLCSTAQCSLLHFDWDKFSIHDKVIERSRASLISVRCTLYVSIK